MLEVELSNAHFVVMRRSVQFKVRSNGVAVELLLLFLI